MVYQNCSKKKKSTLLNRCDRKFFFQEEERNTHFPIPLVKCN